MEQPIRVVDIDSYGEESLSYCLKCERGLSGLLLLWLHVLVDLAFVFSDLSSTAGAVTESVL